MKKRKVALLFLPPFETEEIALMQTEEPRGGGGVRLIKQYPPKKKKSFNKNAMKHKMECPIDFLQHNRPLTQIFLGKTSHTLHLNFEPLCIYGKQRNLIFCNPSTQHKWEFFLDGNPNRIFLQMTILSSSLFLFLLEKVSVFCNAHYKR